MDPLATLADFRVRIPGDVAAADEPRAEAMLEDASALIRSEAGKTWEDETVPDVVRTICMSAAKRAFLNPDGVSAVALDGHSASFTTGSPDVYLTKAERREVRRAGGGSGLWTQPTTRSIDDIGDVPAITQVGVIGGALDEELDPFGAGWPG